MGAGLMESGGFLKETIPQLDGRCPDQDDDDDDTDNDNDNDNDDEYFDFNCALYYISQLLCVHSL